MSLAVKKVLVEYKRLFEKTTVKIDKSIQILENLQIDESYFEYKKASVVHGIKVSAKNKFLYKIYNFPSKSYY